MRNDMTHCTYGTGTVLPPELAYQWPTYQSCGLSPPEGFARASHSASPPAARAAALYFWS